MDSPVEGLKVIHGTILGKGKNVFLLEIPLAIENFVEKLNGVEFLALSSPSVSSSTVVGFEIADSSWSIEARLDNIAKEAFFYLRFRTDAYCALPVTVERCLSVRDASGKTLWVFDIYTEEDRKHFAPDCNTFLGSISAKEAKNWLTDGRLHVCAEVRFKTGHTPWPKLKDAKCSGFRHLLKSEVEDPVLSDFVLVGSDGVQVKAHKLVLGLISPVFRAMFATDCKETQTGVCEMDDADAETIRMLLRCAVEFGNRDNDWLFDTELGLYYHMDGWLLQKVFQLADKYEVLRVKTVCERALGMRLSIENVAEIVLLAEKHSTPVLKNQAFIFIEDHVEEAIEKDVFPKLIDLGRAANLELYEGLKAHSRLRRCGASGEAGEPWRPHAYPYDPYEEDYYDYE